MGIKRILYAGVAAIAVLFVTSCDPEQIADALVLETESFTIPGEGGSSVVSFTATADWEVSSTEKWLSFNPKRGTAGEEVRFTITAEKNPKQEVREAEVVLSVPSMKMSRTIKVTQEAGQKPASTIGIGTTPDVIEQDCGYVRFFMEEFVASDPWTATVDVDWVSIDPSSGEARMYDHEIYITIRQNTTEQARTGHITFTAGDATRVITINQEAGEEKWYYYPSGLGADYTFRSDYLDKECKCKIAFHRRADDSFEFKTITEPATGTDGVVRYGIFNLDNDPDRAVELTFYQAAGESYLQVPYQKLWYNGGKWTYISDYGSYQVRQGKADNWHSVDYGERLKSYFLDVSYEVFLDVYVYEQEGGDSHIINSDHDIFGLTGPYNNISASVDLMYEGGRKLTVWAEKEVSKFYYVVYKGSFDDDDEINYASMMATANQLRENKTNETAINGSVTFNFKNDPGVYTFFVASDAGTFNYKVIEIPAEGDREIEITNWKAWSPNTTTTSISFWLSGTGISQVREMVFAKADYNADPEGCKEKTRNEGELLVTDASQITADSGPLFTCQDLQPGTDYVAVAWVANDIRMDWSVAEASTEGEPEWTYLGKGKLTDDVAWVDIYEKDPVTVDCDVYVSRLSPGKYKVTGYQKAVGCYYLDWAFDSAKEKSYYYDNSVELIIDATNPDAVRIPLQNYGVNVLNGTSPFNGMFWVTSCASNGTDLSVGKLADGVITFPTAEGLRVCCSTYNILPGEEENYTYYTTNDHAAFKIVLPK